MVKFIAFTMYPVKDMARARAFYEKGLGLQAGAEHVGGKWVEYYPENGCFALSSMVPSLKPAASAGAIAFEVDDVDAVVKALEAAGGRASLEPTDTPVCRMAVVIDPEGNSVIIHKRVAPR